jgi:hypothetical protein
MICVNEEGTRRHKGIGTAKATQCHGLIAVPEQSRQKGLGNAKVVVIDVLLI